MIHPIRPVEPQSHPHPPGESWQRSERDASHWCGWTCRGASLQRTGTGLALLTGATAVLLSCMQSKRPALFTSSRHTPLPTHPLERCYCQVTAMSRYTGTGAPRAGIAPRPRARARKATSDSLGLRIGRMHASSTCRRLKMAS